MVHKIHAKQKRMHRSATHLRSIRKENRNRAKRPRTFKSEDAAKAWAEKQGIKNFELVDLRKGWANTKKIKVVEL
jgi:hypothetical protein